jgi:hypothetical protein
VNIRKSKGQYKAKAEAKVKVGSEISTTWITGSITND